MASIAESEPARTGWIIGGMSALVTVAVGVVLYAFPGRTQPGVPGILPTLDAVLNAGSAAFLTAGYVFIRRRQIPAHRACMVTAFVLSCAFLVGYLLHHAQVGNVPFKGTGAIRFIYFAILIPHVILAAPVVPLALLSIFRGWTGRIPQHRRIARWTLPLWLYVSVSGVVVYLMLYHHAP